MKEPFYKVFVLASEEAVLRRIVLENALTPGTWERLLDGTQLRSRAAGQTIWYGPDFYACSARLVVIALQFDSVFMAATTWQADKSWRKRFLDRLGLSCATLS